MKRTHKLRALGDVDAVLRSAPSKAEACKRLGINRTTLERWIKAGKVAPIGAKERAASAASAMPSSAVSPDDWAASVKREQPDLTATDLQLLELARLALLTARDPKERIENRHAAVTRFQALVKHMHLTVEPMTKPSEPPRPTFVPRPARVAVGDPRKALMAVK